MREMGPKTVLVVVIAMTGCGGNKDADPDTSPDGEDVPDASPDPAGDGSDVPEDPSGDEAPPDVPTDDGGDPDGDAPTTTCGDGTLDPGESCDGSAVECTSLGSHWSGGLAPCRADCTGHDVTGCARAAPEGLFEMVKPVERDPGRWGDARCNDGTAFGLGVRLSTTGSDEWIVLLQGGGFCDDYSTPCEGREPELTTTLDIPDGTRFPADVGGMGNPDPAANPVFAGVNFAYAFYCTSDLWAGSSTDRIATTGDPALGWYFSGRHAVRATLEVLAHAYGLDDADPGTRVLFSGFSAGAFGAALNADQAVDLLPASADEGRLLVMLDAGWFVDGWDDPGARIGWATTSDRDVMRRYFEEFSLVPTAQCAAARTAAGGHPGDCAFGDHWYPALVAPPPGGLGLTVLVQQSLIDDVFAAIHGISLDPVAMESYADAQRASMASVDRLFASTASYHVICLWDESWTVGDPGDTFRDVLERFWLGGDPERVFHEP